MLQVTFITPAQTPLSAAGEVQGQAEAPLTEQGHKHVDVVCDGLAAADAPDAIYTAPVTRAWQTAATIGQWAGQTPERDSRLQPRYVGEARGCIPADAIEESPELFERRAGAVRPAVSGGEMMEPLDEVFSRAIDWWQSTLLAEHTDGDRVLAIVPESVVRVLIAGIAAEGLQSCQTIHIPPLTATRCVVSQRGVERVVAVGERLTGTTAGPGVQCADDCENRVWEEPAGSAPSTTATASGGVREFV